MVSLCKNTNIMKTTSILRKQNIITRSSVLLPNIIDHPIETMDQPIETTAPLKILWPNWSQWLVVFLCKCIRLLRTNI